MAAIGKIRQNSGLLLIVIGGAMVAFVLSDMFSAGGGVQQQYIGKIDGKSIDRMVYEQQVQKELDSRNSIGQATSSEMTETIRNNVWNNMVREIVLSPQLQDAGVTVTPEEFYDLTMGANMLPEFRNDPTFINQETGQFDRSLVQQYLDFIRTTPQYRSYWDLQRERIINQRMYDKYNQMISAGLIANQLDAKSEYANQNRRANFSYVVQPYSAIADADISVSERDLKSHYDKIKHESRFQQEESRNFDYVLFRVEPTADDTAAIKEYLEELKEDFAQATRDSVFVVNNSDNRVYSIYPYKSETLQTEAVDNMVMSADSGQVVGPYREGNSFIIAKVIGEEAEDQARVRHILLSTDGKDVDVVRARADSLLRVVRRQRNFEDMVTQFSDDPGSVQNGGVYEWFNRERMVPEFTAASFDEPIGAITIAETQYGFHIVEVLEQRAQPQKQLIRIFRRIEPSSISFEDVYQEANAFSLNFDNAKLFADGAASSGYEIKTAENVTRSTPSVGEIQRPAELIRWAFTAKEGEVSEPIEIDNYVIVGLMNRVKQEGTAHFDDVRDVVEAEVIRDRKAERMIEQMRGYNTLQEAADALSLGVSSANSISFANTSISGVQEPEVVSRALTLEGGQMSLPLKGQNGVYVVQVESIIEPSEVDSYASERRSLSSRMSSRSQNGYFEALREKAEVKDERAKFY